MAAVLLALTAACSSDGTTPVERLAPALRAAVLAPTPPPPPVLGRAELDRVRAATLAVSFDGGPRAYVTAQADNQGYVTYQDPARRGVVLLGGAVAGSLGLGPDLAAVRHQADDPVARPTPLADWPGGVTRSYQYRVRDGAPYAITMACVFARGPRERIEIVERFYEVVRIDETCATAQREVANRYWIDPATGFVWRSRQWLGPNLPPVTLEVIRPFAPG